MGPGARRLGVVGGAGEGQRGRFDGVGKMCRSIEPLFNFRPASHSRRGSRRLAAVCPVQKELGLKLTAGKRPARVIVIDRIERPTPN